jgi:hypothetical protein
MLRKTTTPPRPVTDRAGYTRPVNIVDWNPMFSGRAPREIPPGPGRKHAGKTQAKKEPAKSGADSLVFIKKEPVTFQLSRLKNPEEFERAAFVIRACSTDPHRKHLAVLHVEQTRSGSRLVATDGMRLHICEIPEKIRSGDYKPVVTKDLIRLGEPVTGIMFPNWMKAVPSAPKERGVIHLEETGLGKDRNRTEKLSRVFNAFVRMTGSLINLRYLDDLTKTTWSVHCQAGNRVILLKQERAKMHTCAVIMPLHEADARAA